MDLKILKAQKGENNELELSIEAPVEVSEKAYALALREITNDIDVPGFRKGKVPKEIVEKKVGKGYISQKAFEDIFFEILNNVSSKEKLDIVDVVEIKSFELLPEKPLTFSVLVELKPEVELSKYKDLKIKLKKSVYDKESFIKKTLEKLSNNLLSFKKVTNRTLKEGDLVNIDFKGKFEDGSEVPGGSATDFQTLLEKDKFLPEFVDKLQGLKTGEEKEVEIIFPTNYAQEFSGKKALFKVKINSIEEKIIPEINDEFAKKIGMENLEKLKINIENQMIEIQEVNNQRTFENKLVDYLIENSKFHTPPRMIEREVDYLLNDVKVDCQRKNINWGDFKKDEKNKELFEKAKEAGIKRISVDLVLSALVKKENILITKEEIDSEVQKKIQELGEKYKYLEGDKKFRRTIELVGLRNKAIDFLVKNNEPIWDKEVNIIKEE
ncbi:MAG: trigger factor [Candidatus Melainabacteria bacterium]|nr:trigger factor [Candidatus Melainabacteria bacterium]